jgi:hypothetical protein
MMEEVHTSETSVYSKETTQHYIPEGPNLRTCHCENLKSQTVLKLKKEVITGYT